MLSRLWRRPLAMALAVASLTAPLMVSMLLPPSGLAQGPLSVTAVSAASYEAPIAADSIAALFGPNLATGTEVAQTNPLPLNLQGTTVIIEDSLGMARVAGLFFVSPNQVNVQVPPGTAPGTATIRVTTGASVMSTGTVTIAQAAIGIFAANTDAQGAPAANILRVKADNSQTYENAFAGTYPNFMPRPIDLGPPTDHLFLVLYVTGLRGLPSTDGNPNNGSAENVRAVIGGIEVPPQFAGKTDAYVALDQVNVEIPRALLGSGKIGVSLTATGYGTSNDVEIEIATAAGTQNPQVSGLGGPPNVLARDQITLNGSNLPNNPSEALVRIGGIEAGVESASSSQLQVRVPFGVISGAVTLSTTGGNWTSTAALPVRTSISGMVRDTNEQPIGGARVKLLGNPQFVTTPPEGWFVLPDTPTGSAVSFTVEVPVSEPIPYPNPPLKVPVAPQRDNRYPGTIYLQQASGPSAQIGGDSGGSGASSSDGSVSTPSRARPSEITQVPEITLSTEGVTFALPVGVSAVFPDGLTAGRITLDVLTGSLTPVRLPKAIFSQSIVQITPLGTKFTPGGRFVFPNLDGFPANSVVSLYKFDLGTGVFVDTGVPATVSGNGATITTPPNSITEASYYFAAAPRGVTTLVGRVLDAGGARAVRGALVRARGQETFTDGNGGYILKNVPTLNGATIEVFANLLRFTGRIDRVSGNSQPATVNGLTRVPDLILPSPLENRAPFVMAPSALEVYEGTERQLNITALDLDEGQQITSVVLSGANFAQLIPLSPPIYALRINPPAASQGSYILTIRATDSAGTATQRSIKVTVKARPVATALNLNTLEDSPVQLQLRGIDPDNKPLSFAIVRQPGHGTLVGILPLVAYRPDPDYNGIDTFTFRVSNGQGESAEAVVSINIAPVNDPPQLTVPAIVNVRPGTPIQFKVTATDVDTDQIIKISAENIPKGAVFDVATGTFKWDLPRDTQFGTHKVTFTATDNGIPPLSDSKIVSIIIGDPKAWAPTSGPDGGTTNDFLMIGANILAATDDGGVFLSTNEGVTWSAMNQGLGSPNVRALISFSGSTYAATATGVYRLNGSTWTAVNTGLTNLSARAFAIASGALLVGTEGGVFRLNPGAAGWAQSSNGLQNLNVRALAVWGNDVFAGTLGGVFRSTNLGVLWSILNSGLQNLTITSFAIRPGDLGYTIYAGTLGGGVYSASFFFLLLTASEASGIPAQGLPIWTPVNNGLQRLNVISLALTEGFVFAGTDNGGVFRLLVQNSTWSPANIGLASPFIRVLKSNGSTILAGTFEGGVYKSTNNGATWIASNRGLLRARVASVLLHGPILFAATNGGGVHQTFDTGTIWAAVNGGLTNFIVSSLADDGNSVYAGTFGGGVFRLADNTSTWIPSNNGLTDLRVQSLARGGSTLFAGTEANGIFRSMNQGASWTRAAAGLPSAPVYAILPAEGLVLAGTQGSGVYRSNDNGGSWVPASSGLTNLTVTGIIQAAGAFFCSTGAGVFRSVNNGSTWTPINTGLTTTQIVSLAATPSALLAGAENGSVFYSGDGNSWTTYSQGLPGLPVTSFGGNETALYAGTDGTGVYVVK